VKVFFKKFSPQRRKGRKEGHAYARRFGRQAQRVYIFIIRLCSIICHQNPSSPKFGLLHSLAPSLRLSAFAVLIYQVEETNIGTSASSQSLLDLP
jgi:hypothetical protein